MEQETYGGGSQREWHQLEQTAMQLMSQTLLHRLWPSHPRQLKRLKEQGLQVVRL